MRHIYLDNAATTRTKKEVLDSMLPYFTEEFGNPSSLHEYGLHAKRALQEARMKIAEHIGCEPGEIYITSGGTESDNWAIKGFVHANAAKGRHIITSCIEHHAVLHTCEFLQKEGYEVTYLPVDRGGRVKVEDVEKALRPDTVLISIMYANNEIGTLEPIEEIAELAKSRGVAMHTDAVQAFGYHRFHVKDSGITMLSGSAHKFGGPKGIGFLYVRGNTRLTPLLHGGAQEKRLRAGTENVPGVVGMARALELVEVKLEQSNAYVRELREYLLNRILTEIPYSRLNGDRENRLPGNVNVSFLYIQASSLLVFLDMAGVHCSSGSACTSQSSSPSHVLEAIDVNEDWLPGSIRITLSEDSTRDEIDYTMEKLKETIDKLRNQNVGYKRTKKN